MFFSAQELLDYDANRPSFSRYVRGPLTLANARKYMRQIKANVIAREGVGADKWLRPWHVVPSLRNFSPPEGDYGVGVEIEYGFCSQNAASEMVSKVANWKYVAIDFEGGEHGVEATFAPVLYSKLNNKCQALRYAKLLEDNTALLEEHDAQDSVGTHVNVSAHNRIPYYRVDEVSDILEGCLHMEENYKYFGRIPYGYGNSMGSYVEWKLFNSTADQKRVRQYINIAVALTALAAGNEVIDEDSVLCALEAGYNKRIR